MSPCDPYSRQGEINKVGNTGGNIANSGLAAQQGDWIYYADQDEDGSGLYKIRTDGAGRQKVE